MLLGLLHVRERSGICARCDLGAGATAAGVHQLGRAAGVGPRQRLGREEEVSRWPGQALAR
jgi:hypothetical protein